MDDAPPPMGDNQPPISERLAMDYAETLQRAQDLIDAAERLPQTVELDDTEALGKVAKYVKQCREADAPVEAARKKEKGVFDAMSAEVQAFFTPTQVRLKAVSTRATNMIGDYNRRKAAAEADARRKVAEEQREEANRRAEVARGHEAAGNTAVANQLMEHAVKSDELADKMEAKADAPVADLVRTQTDGALVTGSVKWAFEIENEPRLRQVLSVDLGEHFALSHIEQALRGYARACTRDKVTPTYPGVRFYEDFKGIVR